MAQVFRNRIAVPTYSLIAAVTMTVGLRWGSWVRGLDFLWVVVGSTVATLLLLAAVCQGLFIEVRLHPDSVVLWSPFRFKRIMREEITDVVLWERTPNEESKGLLSQAATLSLNLAGGRKVG